MTRLMTRIRPLTAPIHRIHLTRRRTGREGGQLLVLLPGADERLIGRTELDQLRRSMPNRVA